MSKKYVNPCATHIIPLNNDNNDAFGTSCKHLYNFLHCQTPEYKPLMLKMHLEFIDSTLMTVAEGKNIEQPLEEEIKPLKDALEQSKDDGNQLMDRIDKLEKDNALDYEARQSVQQLETKIKTLEAALLQTKSDGNKLMDRIDKLEKDNALAYERINALRTRESVEQLETKIKTLEAALLQTKSDGIKLELEKSISVDKTSNGGNNITQDPNANNKQTHNVSNLTVGQHNDAENENDAGGSDENLTYTVSEEKQEVLDLSRHCVLIQKAQHNYNNLDQAISYVHELAKEMKAQIAEDSIIHIDMDDSTKWYVYFRDADSKCKFLKNRFIFKYDPYYGSCLRIFDFSNFGIVNIENIQNSDSNSDTAFVNVLGLAKKMGITNISSYIDHVDTYKPRYYNFTYSIRFNREDMKNEFLEKKNNLKEFPETQSLTISDGGGHTLRCGDVNYFNMVIASANIIGITELMGFSLATHNFKRIYVLSAENIHVSLVIEFSSNDIKTNFLKKYSELEGIEDVWSAYIKICDIKTKGNMVSIKYSKESSSIFNVASFIGLAKQLGISFTSDQTSHFIQLSQFISNLTS